jgi:hypothetical protein
MARIILHVDEPLTEEAHVAQLLKDALGEFISAREPAESYIERRYAGQGAQFRARKLAEVSERLTVAYRLKRALFSMEKAA